MLCLEINKKKNILCWWINCSFFNFYCVSHDNQQISAHWIFSYWIKKTWECPLHKNKFLVETIPYFIFITIELSFLLQVGQENFMLRMHWNKIITSYIQFVSCKIIYSHDKHDAQIYSIFKWHYDASID